MEDKRSAFDKFHRKTPERSNETAQMLYDYEKHYMELIKRYRHEIEFINGLHTTHTQEVKNFYTNDLPAIIKKLESEPIVDDVRREWLKHLERHMNNSFDMSGHFIGVLTTKKVEEFNAALREKISGGSVL
ncbi:MAG: hypothetical protein IKI08_06195 [Selenomonadaceae bacterium]|nr:hypothetical protein [Selenomonadaceae bacterium]MBR7025582.1 hypothetical protein [Selenomonadaceae bacterium]